MLRESVAYDVLLFGRWFKWCVSVWERDYIRGRHARAHHCMVARDHQTRTGGWILCSILIVADY